ncbi:MAG: hypothetical protein JW822_06785, partial [Spirochaetales bacterium]|nr:hypothetical protein [Spirochaetales bacterium]
SKTDLDMIKQWGISIERVAGKKTRERIMDGSDNLRQSTAKPDIAAWCKGAVEKMDKLVDEQHRIKIMEQCGHNCSLVNSRVIENALKRRKKFHNLVEFLKAEFKKPLPGTKLEYEGNVIYQYYTPGSYSTPMRCYCSLFRKLPREQQVSITYCHCSRAFVAKYWEAVLGKPVKVEVLESAISGSRVCKFAVYI